MAFELFEKPEDALPILGLGAKNGQMTERRPAGLAALGERMLGKSPVIAGQQIP